MPNEFSYQIKVAYSQTDALGIVYHANYLDYMEQARTNWLASIGFPASILSQEPGIVFVVKDAQITYQRPAYFEQELTVLSRVTNIGKASLVFEQKIVENTCELKSVCQATFKIVCCDKAFKPTAMPAELLTKIQEMVHEP